MSDGFVYQLPQGSDVAGNLPPVNLPGSSDAPPAKPLRITIRPATPASKQVAPPAPDDWSDVSSSSPPAQAQPQQDSAAPDDWSDVSSPAPPPQTSQRQVSTGEAATRGALNAATFGAGPALEGLAKAGAAGKTPQEIEAIQPTGVAEEAPGMEMLGEGLARMFGNHPDPVARAAYEQGRQSALADEKLAQSQHPLAFLAGQMVGTMATPGFGAASAGTLPARLATGAIAGGVGGGLYGAGEAVSKGETLPDVMESAAEGVALGAPTGGVLKGAIGPRAASTLPVTAGERAAATAADLGAPLPRGLTSDSGAVQATTAKLRSVPFAGEKIGERVADTEEAAGNRVADIASTMTGGSTDRAAGDVMLRPGLQQAIDDNRGAIDDAYNNVRGLIDRNAKFTMPRTDAALNAVMASRRAAGWANPAEGLDQFRNVARGATFEGAHRARVDARNAGNALVPHPGYNAADYNRVTRAMTADLREMVQAAAKRKATQTRGMRPNDAAARALSEFDHAEKQFGVLSEFNDRLNGLLKAKGQGAIEKILGAAKDKGGDIKFLAQLKATLPKGAFEQIGGVLLHELGYNVARGEFSLAQFTSNFKRTSDRAMRILFSPAHLRNIQDIVNLGAHIKGALKYSNTSHTASVLVLLDLAKDAALLGGDLATGGGVGLGTAIGAGTTAGLWMLTRWLASPSKAASMAAWSRAYQAYASRPSPASIATFKIATRNLANTLGVDPVKALGRVESMVQGTLPGRAQGESNGADRNQ